MKRDQKNASKVLRAFLTQFGKPPLQAIETSRERLLEQARVVEHGRDAAPAQATDAYKWTIPAKQVSRGNAFAYGLAAAAAVLSLGIVSLFAGRGDSETPYGVVETTEAEIYRLSGNAREALRKGARIGVGDVVRSNGMDGAVVSLTDGSQIELRSQTEFSLESAGDGTRINLAGGTVLVHAARQPQGHLYVKTRDVTVSVIGTVFLVNAEEAGSQVAVIEGEVLVRQGETTQSLLPGEQLLTGLRAESRPVVEEIAWSRRAEAHVALLQQQTAAPAAAPSQKRLEFEVASIRPIAKDRTDVANFLDGVSAPGDVFGDETELRCRGVDGTWSSGDRGRNLMARASSIPLGRCMGIAHLSYFLRAVRAVDHPTITRNDLTSLPAEFERDPDGGRLHYLFNAKAEDPAKTTKADLLVMLRNFTFDRLKLKYHLETRLMDGWAVRIAPGGLRIKETSVDWEVMGPRQAGTIQEFFNALALRDGNLMGHGPVIDMTGLGGKIFEFNWNPGIISPLPGVAGPRGGGVNVNGANVPTVDYSPSLEKQLEEQLGLTIEKAKVPVPYLVVDHLEKPSEN